MNERLAYAAQRDAMLDAARAEYEPEDLPPPPQVDVTEEMARRAHARASLFAACGEQPARDSLTLTGPELAAYRALQAAALSAQQAQSGMATAGTQLREAVQGLCAVIAPGTK